VCRRVGSPTTDLGRHDDATELPTDAPATKPLPDVDLATQIVLLPHPEQNPTSYAPFEGAGTFPFDPGATSISRVKRGGWWKRAWLSYWQSNTAIKNAYKPPPGSTPS
jgi:hypothetical protein